MENLSFDKWYERLCFIFDEQGVPEMKTAGKEAWSDFYDDRYSPEEAFNEELSNW